MSESESERHRPHRKKVRKPRPGGSQNDWNRVISLLRDRYQFGDWEYDPAPGMPRAWIDREQGRIVEERRDENNTPMYIWADTGELAL